MNFFAQQDSARKRTRWLVFWFSAAVITILALTNAVTLVSVANMSQDTGMLVVPDWAWIKSNPMVVIITSAVVLATIGGASMFRMAGLSDGGGSIARAMGGTQVPTDVYDADRRRLRNVVEEIALASGVPVPELYVLEKEGGINAFAAGFAPGDAAIAVSRGALDHLTRDELQGVIAHEFSHILNGDMRMNIRLIGVLFGILVIGLAGRQILRVGHHGGRRNGAPLVAVGLSLLVIGFAGLFFSRIIQAAVSRQREVLADASAVQFTRDPAGISGALKKVAALSQGSVLTEHDATEVSHMLFADGLGKKLFATHPPLEDRIRAIDPHFDSRELADLRTKLALAHGSEIPASPSAAPPGAAGFGAGGTTEARSVATGDVTQDIGAPTWDHIAYAELLRDSIDPKLIEAAHSLRHATDVVFGLMLHRDGGLRDRQLGILEHAMGTGHRERVEALLPKLDQMDRLHRLPLLELAFPAVKRRPEQALRIYIEVMEKLIHADGEISVFEFALARLVRVYLVESMDPAFEATENRDLRLRDVRDDAAMLLTVLADAGHESDERARHAFIAGWNQLFPSQTAEYQPQADWVSPLESALDRVDLLEPLGKEAIVEALTATLAHDGRITLAEVELLRAICASIHCPMPPAIRAT